MGRVGGVKVFGIVGDPGQSPPDGTWGSDKTTKKLFTRSQLSECQFLKDQFTEVNLLNLSHR